MSVSFPTRRGSFWSTAGAAAAVVVLCAVGAGCGDRSDDVAASGTQDSDGGQVPREGTADGGADAEPDEAPNTPGSGLVDQYGQRYCEILTVTLSDQGAAAEVWGTQGLNDCPQEPFDALDPAGIASQLGANLAVLNGPRYWVLDRIVANELAGTLQERDFGGIEMRSIATVELGEGMGDRTPLTETSVARDTDFVFEEGREVFELTAPDGSVYVMQSYSIEVDPDLTAETLGSLGDRLELPEGWAFSSRVLREDLVVQDIDGIATVIQDRFRNSYQLRSRG